MEHDEVMLTTAYFVPEVPVYHAPSPRKYSCIEFAHAAHRAPGLSERQVIPVCGCGRGLHQATQLCLTSFADVDREERCANERLCKLFGLDGRAVIIGLRFTQAKEDDWRASEPGGFENGHIDGSNRALRRPLPKVWFRSQEMFNLIGGQQRQPRFCRP